MNLRILQEKDAPLMLEWMKDPKVNQFFRFNSENITIDTVKEFINVSKKDNDNYHFAIINDKDEYLGTVSIKNVDKEAKNGEYAVSLRSCCQGKGAGRYATEKILEFAFNELKLERIYLNVLSENAHAISFYNRFGFIYEGEFYNHINIRGSLKSLKWFRMMRYEYDSRKV